MKTFTTNLFDANVCRVHKLLQFDLQTPSLKTYAPEMILLGALTTNLIPVRYMHM